MLELPVSPTEKKLTFLIADKWTHTRLDHFMIVISNPYRWLLPTLVFGMLLIYINWQSGFFALVLGGAGAGMADAINTRFIKIHTDRIRPGKQYDNIRSLGVMNKGQKSFPSNHASNTMAFALGFGLNFPWAIWAIIPLSILVGYSRVYCGAHFPLDVLAGWVHGALWVLLLYSVFIVI